MKIPSKARLLAMLLPAALCAPATAQAQRTTGVSALGRLAPEHGVRRIGAASTPEAITVSVLAELLVEEGDDVKAGQLLAVTDSAKVLEARIEQLEAEAKLATRAGDAAEAKANEACVHADVAGREAERVSRLHGQSIVSQDAAERSAGDAEAQAAACTAVKAEAAVADARVEAARARVRLAQAELGRARIRSPMDGRVLDVIARPGEFIGPEGILELGDVSRMYAIAEVYETDIGRVRKGQRARIVSPALGGALSGRVERIRQKVQKQDTLGTDPAARKDARIVEVEILLDEPGRAATLTHLQVEIVIGP